MTVRQSVSSILSATLLLAPLAACGKKGPPLEPLRLVPASVTDVTARRAGQAVALRFTLPTTNANGPGDIDLERVEIYAVTVGPGLVTPANRDLLTKARVVGTIPVRPVLEDGAPEPPPTEKRPSPGEPVTFLEELTEGTMRPDPGLAALPPVAAKPEADAAPAVAKPETGATTPAASPTTESAAPPVTGGDPGKQDPKAAAAKPPAPPAPAGPTEPTRIYVVRGISRGGRPGPPSTRVAVPLATPLAPPSAVVAQMPTEKAVVIEWTPPVAELGAAPLSFNVYRRESPGAPLNPAPLSAVTFEVPGAEFGKEHCFIVRALQTQQNVTLESEASAPACLTPVDKFPPVAPQGLRAVAEDGAISLVWDPNSEPDLAGYLVMRSLAPVEGLPAVAPEPITKQPVKETNYRDATVMPGQRYLYVLVAVDNANPANHSAHSAPEAVTAR